MLVIVQEISNEMAATGGLPTAAAAVIGSNEIPV